jgi:hypothetical protein
MHMQVGPIYLKERVVMTIADEESLRGCFCTVMSVYVILVYGPPLSHLHLFLFIIFTYTCFFF